MSTKLTLSEINKHIDMDKIKKENPSLYASIIEKNKKANKIVRK